eukprot:XP_002532292.2 RING-H2 finger protein ATL52 [Ricinus communis]
MTHCNLLAFELMSTMSNDGDDISNKVTALLIGVGSAALVVTIYHCLATGWCNRDRARANAQRLHQDSNSIIIGRETPSSIENSAARLIPAFKYQKGMGSGGEEATCPICLSEFEEGEEVRSLPECMHSYHLPCIDMWLCSHSNCPVCRADAVSNQIVYRSLGPASEEGSNGNNPYQDLGMLQNIVIQSRTI